MKKNIPKEYCVNDEKVLECLEIAPGVFVYRAKNQHHLASAFLRLQEFYESPNDKFRGNYFTLEDYSDWYAEDRGAFTYYTDWNGFNVPGNVVKDFNSKFAGWPMTNKERFILDSLGERSSYYDSEPFYVIGVHGELTEGNTTLMHELAHAMYCTVPEYKEEVLRIIEEYKGNRSVDYFKATLKKMGYCEEVLVDEVNAYMSTSSMEKLNKGFPKESLDLPLIKELRECYDKFRPNINS